MKAIFVAYNQAYNEEIVEVLEAHGQRGYTSWQEILAMVDDDKVDGILDDLRTKDAESPDLGLRAYVWNIVQAL